jgi:hypothetical protein
MPMAFQMINRPNTKAWQMNGQIATRLRKFNKGGALMV